MQFQKRRIFFPYSAAQASRIFRLRFSVCQCFNSFPLSVVYGDTHVLCVSFVCHILPVSPFSSSLLTTQSSISINTTAVASTRHEPDHAQAHMYVQYTLSYHDTGIRYSHPLVGCASYPPVDAAAVRMLCYHNIDDTKNKTFVLVTPGTEYITTMFSLFCDASTRHQPDHAQAHIQAVS